MVNQINNGASITEAFFMHYKNFKPIYFYLYKPLQY